MVPDLAVSLILVVILVVAFILKPFIKWYSIAQAKSYTDMTINTNNTHEALYLEANDASNFFFGWLALGFGIGMCLRNPVKTHSKKMVLMHL